MCTVTFIPRRNEYDLAMNRDERIMRGTATVPSIFDHGSLKAVYPRDGEDGTWIAANSLGIAFTILNSNDVDTIHEKTRTRGCIIPAVVGSTCSEVAKSVLAELDLQGILPFRLVGFFPAKELVMEWHWDQMSLRRESHPWEIRQWCSSSLSDAEASSRRGSAFKNKVQECDGQSPGWLRGLHASHDPEHPHFSHCVHRGDVETLSYTELVCTSRNLECIYVSGSPCKKNGSVHRVSWTSEPQL